MKLILTLLALLVLASTASAIIGVGMGGPPPPEPLKEYKIWGTIHSILFLLLGVLFLQLKQPKNLFVTGGIVLLGMIFFHLATLNFWAPNIYLGEIHKPIMYGPAMLISIIVTGIAWAFLAIAPKTQAQIARAATWLCGAQALALLIAGVRAYLLGGTS